MEQTRINNTFQDYLKFYNEVVKVCKEPYKQYTFICPICEGNALGMKAKFNGHIRAVCSKCNLRIMQ